MPELTTGLTTQLDTAAETPALRIAWIGWASPFRDTEAAVGDAIVAVDGEPVTLDGPAARLVGQYDEGAALTARGRSPGDSLTLRLRRRTFPRGWRTFDVSAPIAERLRAQNAEGREILAPDGPITMDNDGMSGSWASWAEAFERKVSQLLDRDRHTGTFVSRFEARDLAERFGPRVALATERYPGRWSAAVRTDYERALALTRGESVTLPPNALDFRRRGAELAAEVRAQGRALWDTLRNAAETIAPFPALNPVRDSVESVTGRLVALPPLGDAQWVSDSGHGWFVAGSPTDGFYFLDAESEAAEAMLRARRRYARLVDPSLAARYEFLARITGDSRLVMVGERPYFGLVAEPVAALVGDAMGVDLAARSGTHAPFAGENALLDDTPDLPPDDAPPETVLAALVGAVKQGDLALWRALHVRWEVARAPNDDGTLGRWVVVPYAGPPRDDRFEDSRRSMAARVADARVAWVGEPVVVRDGTAFPGALRVEEVQCWLDHVGDERGDGDFRVFQDVTVSKRWTLQRVDGGPWRVATVQSI